MRVPRTYYRLAAFIAIFITFIFVLHTIVPASVFPNQHNSAAAVRHAENELSQKDPNEKVDWHNYSQIQTDKLRTGPGEQGTGYVADIDNNPEQKKLKQKLFRANGFEAYISDKISLHRALQDIRHKKCQFVKYRRKLPTASIVIPFHQEHLSTLKRTFISALNRAPEHLIKEVILVDDASTKEFLKSELDEYVAKYFPKVRIVRLNTRSGLIRARLAGAEKAEGDVIIFLDSHCETNVNWLPPLLDPIAEDYRTVVCPFIDVISNQDFAYSAQDEGMRGAFSWQLFYKRLPRLPEDQEHPERPFASPVMAGGLFAISRHWFWELGGYDKGLEIWGGEQYELSFKIWMCGGRMIDAPCSRIGHVYRKFVPFTSNLAYNYLDRNHKRVIEVWMDDHKEFVYKRNPYMRSIDAGDLSEARFIRQRLHCKSFAWFMKNVSFDLPKWYPPVTKDIAKGRLRCEAATDLCVDLKFGSDNNRVVMAPCSAPGKGEQALLYHWNGAISSQQRPTYCLDGHSVSSDAIMPVLLFTCHNQRGNQMFVYDSSNNKVKHKITDTCLTCIPFRRELELVNCEDSPQQQWKWENGVDEEAVRELQKIE